MFEMLAELSGVSSCETSSESFEVFAELGMFDVLAQLGNA